MAETTYTLENAKSGRSKCGVSKASHVSSVCLIVLLLRPKNAPLPRLQGPDLALVEKDELALQLTSPRRLLQETIEKGELRIQQVSCGISTGRSLSSDISADVSPLPLLLSQQETHDEEKGKHFSK